MKGLMPEDFLSVNNKPGEAEVVKGGIGLDLYPRPWGFEQFSTRFVFFKILNGPSQSVSLRG
jgi:hypothetical protein